MSENLARQGLERYKAQGLCCVPSMLALVDLPRGAPAEPLQWTSFELTASVG